MGAIQQKPLERNTPLNAGCWFSCLLGLSLSPMSMTNPKSKDSLMGTGHRLRSVSSRWELKGVEALYTKLVMPS